MLLDALLAAAPAAEGLATRLLERMGNPLVLFGLFGQVVFMMRFVLQWYVSERLRRSHIPVGFWYLSVLGGVILMVYGILDADPVIILGQGLGLGIYVRNLVLIRRTQRAAGASAE